MYTEAKDGHLLLADVSQSDDRKITVINHTLLILYNTE